MERAMRTRCVLQQDPQHDDEIVDRAMSLVGPTLDTDLEATCSECGSEQSVPFRIDEFLLAALRRESVSLTREVHELALAYRWSRREISRFRVRSAGSMPDWFWRMEDGRELRWSRCPTNRSC